MDMISRNLFLERNKFDETHGKVRSGQEMIISGRRTSTY
jgi:hypothetical protein